jgi:DNA recombination-dependent growth factor C
MNLLDILPDDVIEIINQNVCTQIYERKLERKQRKKLKKEKKKREKQYKICEKLLEEAYCRYNNISSFEFCIGEMPYIKINLIDSRFNQFSTILIFE